MEDEQKTQVTHPYDITQIGRMQMPIHTSSDAYFPQEKNPYSDLDFGFDINQPNPYDELGINVDRKKLTKLLLKAEDDPEYDPRFGKDF